MCLPWVNSSIHTFNRLHCQLSVWLNFDFIYREAIQEDDRGNLEASVAEIIQKAKRQAQLSRKGHTRLGMMRHMFIILDSSDAMLDQDLKPTRQFCTLKVRNISLNIRLYMRFWNNCCLQLIFFGLKRRFLHFTALGGFYRRIFVRKPSQPTGIYLDKKQKSWEGKENIDRLE